MTSIDRDDKQRFWGAQGFSFLLHASMLLVLAVMPEAIRALPDGTISIEVISSSKSIAPPKGNQIRNSEVVKKPLNLKAKSQRIREKKKVAAAAVKVKKQKPKKAKESAKKLAKKKRPGVKPVVVAKAAKRSKKAVAAKAVPADVKVGAKTVEAKRMEKLDRELNTLEREMANNSKDLDNQLVAVNKVRGFKSAMTEKSNAEGDTSDSGKQGDLEAKDGETDRDQQAQPDMAYGIPTGVVESKHYEVPGNIPPEYPVEERLARREGQVEFYAYIRDGRVEKIRLKKSSGRRSFDKAALTAYKKYRFFSGKQGWVSKPFRFSLTGKTQFTGGRLRR